MGVVGNKIKIALFQHIRPVPVIKEIKPELVPTGQGYVIDTNNYGFKYQVYKKQGDSWVTVGAPKTTFERKLTIIPTGLTAGTECKVEVGFMGTNCTLTKYFIAQ